MFGTLAHELRNPLAVLTNAAALIDLAYPGDPTLAYVLQVLHRQTDYVRSLVDDALGSVGPQVREHGRRVEVPLPIARTEMQGYALRPTQVLANLLTNASKFSPPHATIWVKAVEADEVVVRVEDEGQGIAPAMLPHVFELSSQADPGKGERATQGLGLGLALVKEYVELHGGSVQVRSEGMGRGSGFTIRLPLFRRGDTNRR